MSEEKAATAPAATARGGSGVLGMLLPAVLAAGAAFGGAKVAGARHAVAAPPAETAEAPRPPGPTLPLDPFVLTIPDSTKKVHPMKVTIAVEFGPKAKEEELKALVPRIRDSALGYFRTLTYEEVIDPAVSDKMRAELVEHLKAAGAGAEHVLITDLVLQ